MHKELDKNADSSTKMNAFSDLFNKKSVKAGFGEKKMDSPNEQIVPTVQIKSVNMRP